MIRVKVIATGEKFWIDPEDEDKIGKDMNVDVYPEWPGCRPVKSGFVCTRSSHAKSKKRVFRGEGLEIVSCEELQAEEDMDEAIIQNIIKEELERDGK